jgi:AcrR family transcriptional regulator
MRETNRDRQREATKRRLFDASLEEIARVGLEQASVERITEGAGTSRTAYYFHFPKKEAVLEVLAQQLSSLVAGRLDGLPDDAPLEAILDLFSECVIGFWNDRRGLAADAATVWLAERPMGQLRHTLAQRVHQSRAIDWAIAQQLVDRLVISHWIFVLKWGLGQVESLSDAMRTLTDVFLNGAVPRRQPLRLVPAPGSSPTPPARPSRRRERSAHGGSGKDTASPARRDGASGRRDAS